MATKAKNSNASGAARKSTSGKSDAITLLKADHAEVKRHFIAYEKLVDNDADAEEREEMAQQICLLLTVHATLEEEIFYPAAREVLDEEQADLIDEADVEHASARDLMAQIRDGNADDHLYDAKVKVLGEYMDHHVKEEQDEIFPKVKKAGLDLDMLGEELALRKEELMAEEAGTQAGTQTRDRVPA